MIERSTSCGGRRAAALLVAAALVGPPADAQTDGADAPLTALVETDRGAFVVRLLREAAPRHVAHFVATAEAGDYDGTVFHRIIPRGIIQGGDPISRDPEQASLYGTGGLGVLAAEFSDRPMTRGSLAAVLRPGQPDSGGSQFFICLSDQLALTGQYTIYGEVVEGMDVVDAIGATPVDGDRALERVAIRGVAIRGGGEPEP